MAKQKKEKAKKKDIKDLKDKAAQTQKEVGEAVALDNLTLLGSEETTYDFDYDPSYLETFPNPSDSPYQIQFGTDEFTSLCPKTGQPDFAHIEIVYTPRKLCVESKSLKLYLFSFRNCGAFMEKICNTIADDLMGLLNPIELCVITRFAPRGGIATNVKAERYGKEI